ncbi:MAG: sulfurtransferase TusA family protein [Methanomassiliicoccus sp.]|nr:sulfurtransferase TusA family protein [Methanomassiliicoccus sp.]
MVETLDVKGMMCPMPIVQLAKKMKTMKIGDEVDLIASDIGSKNDVPAWCQRTGNQLVEMKEGNGIFTYRIKKLK